MKSSISLSEIAEQEKISIKYLEAIFARGDRACADLLERAFRLGCRFDGWDDALKVELWDVVGVFGAILLLVVLATVLSIAATAGLGLIAFVPIATLIVLPLQLGAWLLRNLVFQYLGLTALAAYLHLYQPLAAGAPSSLSPRDTPTSHS